MIVNLFTFFSALLISWLLLYPLVWLLHAFKLGQPIRLEGPAAHQAKAGTPTMGGLGFILDITLMLLVMIDYDIYPKYLGLIVLLLGFGGIGLIDDLLKIKRGKNLGLTFWQKILSQIIVAGLFGWLIITTGEFLPTSSWLWQFGFGEPLLYQLLTIFLVIGAANATNLTDGLNGLLAGTGTIAYLAFAVMLATGLEGVKKGLMPPAPVEEDIYEFTGDRIAELGIESLNENLMMSLKKLEKDEIVREALGEHVYQAFRRVKIDEWDRYRMTVSQWEIQEYLGSY